MFLESKNLPKAPLSPIEELDKKQVVEEYLKKMGL
jgi:hypothetical protein